MRYTTPAVILAAALGLTTVAAANAQPQPQPRSATNCGSVASDYEGNAFTLRKAGSQFDAEFDDVKFKATSAKEGTITAGDGKASGEYTVVGTKIFTAGPNLSHGMIEFTIASEALNYHLEFQAGLPTCGPQGAVREIAGSTFSLDSSGHVPTGGALLER